MSVSKYYDKDSTLIGSRKSMHLTPGHVIENYKTTRSHSQNQRRGTFWHYC